MDWHCKNVVTIGMRLRQYACALVCNQRIIAHSFQSLGRHKFSGSSLLCALPKKADEVPYTYYYPGIYVYTHNVVLMKNKNFINQCHFIMRVRREQYIIKKGVPIFALSPNVN